MFKKSRVVVNEQEFSPSFAIQTFRSTFNSIASLNYRKSTSSSAKRTTLIQNAIPLNRGQVSLCKEMWKTHFFNAPSQRMKSTLFKTSFTAFYGNSSSNIFFKTSERQTQIFSEYYIPFLSSVWDRKQMLGIVPYYFEEIKIPKQTVEEIRSEFRIHQTQKKSKKTQDIHSTTITLSHTDIPIDLTNQNKTDENITNTNISVKPINTEISNSPDNNETEKITLKNIPIPSSGDNNEINIADANNIKPPSETSPNQPEELDHEDLVILLSNILSGQIDIDSTNDEKNENDDKQKEKSDQDNDLEDSGKLSILLLISSFSFKLITLTSFFFSI